MNITYEMIIDTLKTWGYNAGDFEEVVAKLAQGDEANIKYAEAEANQERDTIHYTLRLTPQGVELYERWCNEYQYTPSLKGKVENVLEFADENRDSVDNTLEEWEESLGE